MAYRARIREIVARLWREHTAPHRLGAAVAVGIVVGCSPFFGLHLWIGLGLAVLFRLNKVAVFLGSQVSIPPLAPLLSFTSIQIGALIQSGEIVRLGLDDFTVAGLPQLLRLFLLDWLIGGLVVGSVLALPAFLITTLVVRGRRAKADPWRRDLERAAVRYGSAPRSHRHYVRFKYRMDPLYRQICDLLGQRTLVIDLGTGLGMLPLLLALRGQIERVIGLDWDAAKIASGRRAVGPDMPRVELVHQDIRDWSLEPGQADAVVLADVLHYWPLEQQDSILQGAVRALRPGGRLVIRDTDRQARSWLTRLLEALAVRVGWNRGPSLTYRTEDELRQALQSLRLRCGPAEASSSSLHRGNILVWADRVE